MVDVLVEAALVEGVPAEEEVGGEDGLAEVVLEGLGEPLLLLDG